MSKPIDAVAVENISKILGEYTTGPKSPKCFLCLDFSIMIFKDKLTINGSKRLPNGVV